MTDDMESFEDEVRAMLSRRAADVDGSTASEPVTAPRVRSLSEPAGRRPRRMLLTVAAVVALVAVVGVGLIFRDDDRSVEIDSVAPTTTPQELPAWFDPSTATAVYDTAYDDPQAAAEDYLRARFPDFPVPDVAIASLAVRDDLATARWGVQEQDPPGPDPSYRGEILLRLVDASWDVVASTTEGVHLSGVQRRDRLLAGEVTSEGIDMLALDVLGLDGEPVADAPEPDGYPGAQYRFGTAGVSDTGPNSAGIAVPVNIEVGDSPVIVRAQHVGGTLLSVAEVVFPGPGSEPTPEQIACSQRALDQLDPQTDATVYLDPTVSPARAAATVEAMDQEPGVAVVRFLDQQQVYEQFKVLFHDQPEIVESVTPDILPPAIEVSLDASADVDAFIAGTMQSADVRDVVSRSTMAENFVSECGEIGRPRATVPPSIPPTTVPTVTTTIPAATMEAFNAVQTAVITRLPEYPNTIDVNRHDSYTEFEFGNGSGAVAFSLQIFDSGGFSKDEMELLTELETGSEDQAWLGADDPDLRSVYYLSADGIGLRAASIASGTSEPLSVNHLVSTAADLTADPAVIDLAVTGNR
jgi:hypothetical protein